MNSGELYIFSSNFAKLQKINKYINMYRTYINSHCFSTLNPLYNLINGNLNIIIQSLFITFTSNMVVLTGDLKLVNKTMNYINNTQGDMILNEGWEENLIPIPDITEIYLPQDKILIHNV